MKIRLLSMALIFGMAVFCSSMKTVSAQVDQDTVVPESNAGAATTDLGGNGNIVIDGGNDVGTITGSDLRGAAAFQESLGRRGYFDSLSAINLQKAIDLNLSNRKESLEAYYERREYRENSVRGENRITQEEATKLAKDRAPARLTSQDYDSATGRIFWPRPLDSEVLHPYTNFINRNFAKRSQSGKEYTAADARSVERMVMLIQEAVDSVKKELPVKEYIAISDYLASVSYEASFDHDGNRITQ
jgi:hypothetical protein